MKKLILGALLLVGVVVGANLNYNHQNNAETSPPTGSAMQVVAETSPPTGSVSTIIFKS